MKILKKNLNLSCLVLFTFLLVSAAESKAQHKEMSDKDLTDVSTAILYGRCSKVKSEWNAAKDKIFTTVTVIPEEYLKGNLGSEAVLTIPGGQVGDIIYEVSEMPVFTEGEEVVAFVWKNPSGKNLVTAGNQGMKKIEKDARTGKRVVKGKNSDSENNDELLETYVTKLKGYMKH